MGFVGIKTREEIKPEAARAAPFSDRTKTTDLVDRAARGDINAFGELYSLYLDPIFRYVYYQVNDRMTAEDITEEVFLKAWKSISSCKGKGKTFSSWLYRIAHNHMINTLRRTQRFTPLDDKAAEKADTTVNIEEELEGRELRELINILPPNQKRVIILKFIEGLDNREISKAIHKREGAIRVLQMRGLLALREKLGG